jgi:hypothetical protein
MTTTETQTPRDGFYVVTLRGTRLAHYFRGGKALCGCKVAQPEERWHPGSHADKDDPQKSSPVCVACQDANTEYLANQ